jgi:hypothetical protein
MKTPQHNLQINEIPNSYVNTGYAKAFFHNPNKNLLTYVASMAVTHSPTILACLSLNRNDLR